MPLVLGGCGACNCVDCGCRSRLLRSRRWEIHVLRSTVTDACATLSCPIPRPCRHLPHSVTMGRRTGRTKKKNKGQNFALGRAVIRKATTDRRKAAARADAKCVCRTRSVHSRTHPCSVVFPGPVPRHALPYRICPALCVECRTGFQVADLEAENNLTSVTQASSLEEFMANAVAEGRDFTATRDNAVIIDGISGAVVGQEVECVPCCAPDIGATCPHATRVSPCRTEGTIEQLRIPRRPAWKMGMDKAELHRLENEAFLKWRRNIAKCVWCTEAAAELAVRVGPDTRHTHAQTQREGPLHNCNAIREEPARLAPAVARH